MTSQESFELAHTRAKLEETADRLRRVADDIEATSQRLHDGMSAETATNAVGDALNQVLWQLANANPFDAVARAARLEGTVR